MKTKDKNRLLDQLKKDIEIGMRKMNSLKSQLNSSQVELEAYQREKQSRLNQVNCTVVLNYSQIVEFCREGGEVSDYLVFSKTALSDLYKRVGVLEKEDFQQKAKFETYHKHLTRMKKDILYMNMKMGQLKNEMVSQMYSKFGRVVNISELELAVLKKSFQKTYVNELEEVVLKRLVCDLRLKLTDIKSRFAEISNAWNRKIKLTQEELTKTIKENTLKLELMEVISREKKELVKIIFSQPKKNDMVEKTEHAIEIFYKDIEKLESILQNQQGQLEELKNEIKMLKTKGLPPAPIGERLAEEAVKRTSKDSLSKRWSEYDSYIDEEAGSSEEKHFVQEINIPGFYSTESEDIVRHLLQDIFEQAEKQFDENTTEQMVRSILLGIINCESSEEIANEIFKNVSSILTNDQKADIESVAKKLYKIQDPEVDDETFELGAREILEEILAEVLDNKDQPADEFVANIVQALTENVPVDYLLTDESLNVVADKVNESLRGSEVDIEKVSEIVSRTSSIYNEEMKDVLNIILERVFNRESDMPK